MQPLSAEAQAALNQRLWDAATVGDVAAIERLAGEGASLDAKDKYGSRSAVLVAARAGRTASVEALVRLGADPNATDSGGGTALMRAAERGQAGVVAALLHGGAAVDAAALVGAARKGKAECARLLLAAAVDPARMEAGAGSTLRRSDEKTALEEAEQRSRGYQRPAKKRGLAEVVALLEARLSAAEKVRWEKRRAEIREEASMRCDQQRLDDDSRPYADEAWRELAAHARDSGMSLYEAYHR